ncbi:DUF1217 domain-containing protein [Thetidibacter halocola]|uniref:DUF1217 domain-containing protein n=1 Tax=Thetidibacter halocola TaxID=2827239 RepID=A0A8J8B7F6_9RHOB|nr:DUF1217 domain-containing protein [Thetidibacter halocola]MBS0123664.1 DUF1217 domain-containing protein [Thetidibacter halocola]
MTFRPIVVGTGLVAWQFLKTTQGNQKEVFDKSPQLARDTDYFAAKIAEVTTAEQLVSDRRLLRVALGAFGLQDDINNRAFIQKILAEGTTDREALANKLTDDRYKALAKAFQFDNPIAPRTQRTAFPAEIIDRFRAQEFEIAVGEQDDALRLALNLQRSLPEVAEGEGGDDAKWFRVMGTPPLRSVFETALGLPKGFGQLDIDQQLGVFRDKMQSRFGVKEVRDIASDPAILEKVVQTYLLQTEVQQFSQASSGAVALSLLQAIPRTSLLG